MPVVVDRNFGNILGTGLFEPVKEAIVTESVDSKRLSTFNA
jgi:hypothetical protein